MYGLERNQDIQFKVKINTGVGATNKEVQLQAITTAEQTAMQNLQIAMQMQDMENATVYRKVLNDLFLEKLSLIGLKNIEFEMKGMLDGKEEQLGNGGEANPAVSGNQINPTNFSMEGNAGGDGQPLPNPL